ncbi:hypothetical protein HanPSC8_Chr08g0317511 [Helianthus annuus]|nr:hypothetical protein HanPSC8_Chr08g0317511 [Helianthus annuus]
MCLIGVSFTLWVKIERKQLAYVSTPLLCVVELVYSRGWLYTLGRECFLSLMGISSSAGFNSSTTFVYDFDLRSN